MLLGHDVVADRQAEASAFTGRLCGEEWLKELVFNLGWNAGAVVAYADLDRFAEISRRYPQRRLEIWVSSFPLTFGGRVEPVGEQIQTDPFDWWQRLGIFSL
jgi:hypothetical protein